jgi:hypothetical protein
MEAKLLAEILVNLYQTARRHMSEDSTFHSHCYQNFRFICCVRSLPAVFVRRTVGVWSYSLVEHTPYARSRRSKGRGTKCSVLRKRFGPEEHTDLSVMSRQEMYLFYLNKAFDESGSFDQVNERGGGI